MCELRTNQSETSDLMISRNFVMSVLLLSILGVSSGLQHCPMWKEIAPCSCRLDSFKITSINCERMTSFQQVVDVLGGHFQPSDKVILRLASSIFNDLSYRSFEELNVTIENLKLNHDVIGTLNPESFNGLTRVTYLSLADNCLEEVPEVLWKKMPIINTLDLGRTKIKSLHKSSFSDLRQLECLVLAGNQITQVDAHSIPTQIQRLHLGRNFITDLNNTLRNLSDLGWLFVNGNNLTNLDGQLPRTAPNLKYIHASHNRLEKLPTQLKNFQSLESLFFHNNRLKSLDGALAKNDRLMRVVLENNQIDTLTEADFSASMNLESLLLGHNQIYTLNNSLVNLRKLNFLNLTCNQIVEFSFQEVADLRQLRIIDVSYNKIATLVGPTPNLVEYNIKLNEIKLDHNQIETLDGALSGFSELLRLDLSYNKLKRISPEDLIGLEQLRLLDVSHNHLTTLEETSKTYLPRLSELKASHNYLTILEKDFHGLPVLCHADLSNNQIIALGRDLVAKTRCTIEHGVHEGTWDTLKIYLQDNPILCDAALPDMMSIMEINHTRIYGVSHCPPLSEQPTTSKPTAFFGYIPERTPGLHAAISAHHENDFQREQTNDQRNKLNSEPVDNQNSHDHSVEKNETFAFVIQKDTNINDNNNDNVTLNDNRAPADENDQQTDTKQKSQIFDPIKQGQQINKLATEIRELRTRIDALSSQNQLLLNQQSNSSNNKDSREDLSELRKP